MNFNYDLATWIDYFIGSLSSSLAIILCYKIFYNIKFKNIKIIEFIALIISSVLLVFNTLIFDNIGKVFGILLILFCINKFVFKQNIVNSLYYGIVTHIIFLVSEVIVSVVLMALTKIFSTGIAVVAYNRTAFLNITVSAIACLLAFL